MLVESVRERFLFLLLFDYHFDDVFWLFNFIVIIVVFAVFLYVFITDKNEGMKFWFVVVSFAFVCVLLNFLLWFVIAVVFVVAKICILLFLFFSFLFFRLLLTNTRVIKKKTKKKLEKKKYFFLLWVGVGDKYYLWTLVICVCVCCFWKFRFKFVLFWKGFLEIN